MHLIKGAIIAIVRPQKDFMLVWMLPLLKQIKFIPKLLFKGRVSTIEKIINFGRLSRGSWNRKVNKKSASWSITGEKRQYNSRKKIRHQYPPVPLLNIANQKPQTQLLLSQKVTLLPHLLLPHLVIQHLKLKNIYPFLERKGFDLVKCILSHSLCPMNVLLVTIMHLHLTWTVSRFLAEDLKVLQKNGTWELTS